MISGILISRSNAKTMRIIFFPDAHEEKSAFHLLALVRSTRKKGQHPIVRRKSRLAVGVCFSLDDR